MKERAQIHVPFRTAFGLVESYIRTKVKEQVRAVAFVILYLLAFQILVLGSAPSSALRLSLGIAMVVFGLTFFLEGLMLGLMPLGERVGVQLPRRSGLAAIVFFGLLLGFVSTQAEPAIATLRVAGSGITPWNTPLLFMMLERHRDALVGSIGAGVGIGVALSMLRFYRGLSIKPFIYTVVPPLLGLSIYCALNDNLVAILGLAWDAGAVTTGAVTVPLVLALGIGVSRAAGRQEKSGGGFGAIMLASAYPVLGVLLLGLFLNNGAPRSVPEAEFFSPTHRAEALRLFTAEDDLTRFAFQRGGPDARRALYAEESDYEQAVRSLADSAHRRTLLGEMPLTLWAEQRASARERALLPQGSEQSVVPPPLSGSLAGSFFATELKLALRAVIPLTLLLVLVMAVFLRDRPRHRDEVALGISLAVVGMALLTGGIRWGLAPLGDEVGRLLPRLHHRAEREEGRIVLPDFDPAQVVTSFDADGAHAPIFFLRGRDGKAVTAPYDPAQFDASTGRYEHIILHAPMFGPNMTPVGIALILLFAFGLGYGSTLAEPALSALGRTVEEISIGTIRRMGVVRAVSLGVGTGLIAGIVRILFDVPTIWMLVPPYLLLLPLTYFSEEDFVGIAWDSGGVTTGVVTVPLVLAMGLGIGGELQVTDGFGILAMASVYPIISVLLYGLMVRSRQRRAIRFIAQEDGDA